MRHRHDSLIATDAIAGLRARLRPWAVLTIVVLLPLVNLWTIDQLDRHHRSISETPANALVKSFAIDPPWRASATRTDAALSTAGPDVPGPVVRKSEAPPAQMAIVTTVGLPATKTLMTPTSYWHSPEMIAAFAANAALVGLVVMLLLGISVPRGARDLGPGAPAIARPEVTTSDAVNGDAHAGDDLTGWHTRCARRLATPFMPFGRRSQSSWATATPSSARYRKTTSRPGGPSKRSRSRPAD